MKKITGYLLTLSLAAGLLCGCGAVNPGPIAEPGSAQTQGAEVPPAGANAATSTDSEPEEPANADDAATAETAEKAGDAAETPHEHEWTEATCTAPSTCAVCGETRGEPLAHTPTEADYWTPSVCAVCGTELAPKLVPDFEKYGLVCDDEELTFFPVVCDAGEYGSGIETIGQAYVYRSFYSSFHDFQVGWDPRTHDRYIWNFEEKEGYEWQVLFLTVLYGDENALQYGPMDVTWCHEDYYDIRFHDDTTVYDYDLHEYGYGLTYQLNYKGELYDCRLINYGNWRDTYENNQFVLDYAIAFQVPTGYDGCVIGVGFPRNEWDDGEYIFDVADENTHFFRLGAHDWKTNRNGAPNGHWEGNEFFHDEYDMRY